MTPLEHLVRLYARTVALDLLMRAVFTQWAAQQPDPKTFLLATVEGIIGSMDAVENRPRTETDRLIWEGAERELRAFLENVSLRLP